MSGMHKTVPGTASHSANQLQGWGNQDEASFSGVSCSHRSTTLSLLTLLAGHQRSHPHHWPGSAARAKADHIATAGSWLDE